LGPESEQRRAYVLQVGEDLLVCPWQTRLRAWEALEAVRRELPAETFAACWPVAAVREADAEHSRWRADHPEARPHILSSRWAVPLPWFALVAPEQRTVSLDGPRELVYRSPMVQARTRAARALRSMRRGVQDGPVTDELAEVGRWLEQFHPRSWLELDYAGLVGILDDEALRSDCSAEDVAEGLSALDAGDVPRAARAYARLRDRWTRVAAVGRAS
ncbi:MAG: hypothetical protein M3Q27_02070, partial [Actinomycetota bacterium]|nr:hypothetical protein [Actinomycetota bacterium]